MLMLQVQLPTAHGYEHGGGEGGGHGRLGRGTVVWGASPMDGRDDGGWLR